MDVTLDVHFQGTTLLATMGVLKHQLNKNCYRTGLWLFALGWGSEGFISRFGAHPPPTHPPPDLVENLVRAKHSRSALISPSGCPKAKSHNPAVVYSTPVSRPLQLTRTSDLPAGGQSLIDLKSTYCFGAHMHEIMKYFLFTENQ